MRTKMFSSIVALTLICTGCTDSVQGLVDRTRRAGTADQWRAWAAQVLSRSLTNSTPLLRSEWPEFVRRTVTEDRAWQVSIDHTDGDANGAHLVMLLSPGGFESIGVIIGPASFMEIAPTQYPQTSKEVYPGIYVRDVH